MSTSPEGKIDVSPNVGAEKPGGPKLDVKGPKPNTNPNPNPIPTGYVLPKDKQPDDEEDVLVARSTRQTRSPFKKSIIFPKRQRMDPVVTFALGSLMTLPAPQVPAHSPFKKSSPFPSRQIFPSRRAFGVTEPFGHLPPDKKDLREQLDEVEEKKEKAEESVESKVELSNIAELKDKKVADDASEKFKDAKQSYTQLTADIDSKKSSGENTTELQIRRGEAAAFMRQFSAMKFIAEGKVGTVLDDVISMEDPEVRKILRTTADDLETKHHKKDAADKIRAAVSQSESKAGAKSASKVSSPTLTPEIPHLEPAGGAESKESKGAPKEEPKESKGAPKAGPKAEPKEEPEEEEEEELKEVQSESQSSSNPVVARVLTKFVENTRFAGDIGRYEINKLPSYKKGHKFLVSTVPKTPEELPIAENQVIFEVKGDKLVRVLQGDMDDTPKKGVATFAKHFVQGKRADRRITAGEAREITYVSGQKRTFIVLPYAIMSYGQPA